MAKKNLGTSRDMAPLTVGLGPGFTAGEDVDYVIETMRGHNLGRIIKKGSALPNTGVPGLIAGIGKERVIHSPAAGEMKNISRIADIVEKDQIIAMVDHWLRVPVGGILGSDYGSNLYDYLHPAVLQALQHVVRDAHAEGKPVSICGEMAGDPAAAVLLMAMGFDSLSMNATNLPKVKWMLRQVELSRAKELLAEVMTIDNPQVIRSTVQLALKNMGLTRMMNPAAIKPY